MAECNTVDRNEQRRLERAKKKAEKEKEKNYDRAVKKAVAESRKEVRPGERVKQLVLELGKQLISTADVMAPLVTKLSELEVEYEVVDTSAAPPLTGHAPLTTGTNDDNVVLWKRCVTERNVDSNAKIIQSTIHQLEPYVLVVISGRMFLDLVRSTRQVSSELPGGTGYGSSYSLLDKIRQLLSKYKGKKLTIGIQNLDGALRDQKTQKNRRLRAAVREGSHVEHNTSCDISRLECEQALVNVQLKYGSSCCIRMCPKPLNVAELIVTMTKSIAEVPFKKENPFSFYADLVPGATKKALKESNDKVSLIWQSQLMQIPGVSHPVASAIAAQYSSPAQLMEEYEKSSSTIQAQRLLEDIQIRRGTGVIATTRRVGPTLSSKIHTFLTTKDKDALLS